MQYHSGIVSSETELADRRSFILLAWVHLSKVVQQVALLSAAITLFL
jgi:hypothetical protein